jgi:hypothetical protein
MDWLGDLLGDALVGDRRLSKRGETVVRWLFGLLLVGLAAAGAWKSLTYEAGWPFRVVGALFFVALASFGLFSVCLRRPWRWPGCSIGVALALLFAVRILFGP